MTSRLGWAWQYENILDNQCVIIIKILNFWRSYQYQKISLTGGDWHIDAINGLGYNHDPPSIFNILACLDFQGDWSQAENGLIMSCWYLPWLQPPLHNTLSHSLLVLSPGQAQIYPCYKNLKPSAYAFSRVPSHSCMRPRLQPYVHL